MGLTHKKDLRTGRPVWSVYRHEAPAESRLLRSVRADVVIVGAGITGALLAHSLVERGHRPLILERRRGAMLGSTAASTALLQFELDTPLVHLGRKIGVRAAERAWKCSYAAVNELRTQAIRCGIPARLETRPSLYLAGNLLDARGLAREVKRRQALGLPSEWLSRQSLRHHFDIDRPAAILSHGNAEADPVALAGGFLSRAIRRGARLHAPHEVVDLHASARGATLVTQEGLEIQGRHVVFCTGYELPKIVKAEGHRIESTWAIATDPQPQRLWPQRALIWEASEPYLYARATASGHIIFGGEDEPISDAEKRDSLIDAKTGALEKKLAKLFPHVNARARFAWTGSFGASASGVPTFGRIPDYPCCFAVLGYGGNGITFSMLAARMIAEALSGKPDEDSGLFAFR
jgi:glycine/D-amino acid oxidase-like deaminating enzyme